MSRLILTIVVSVYLAMAVNQVPDQAASTREQVAPPPSVSAVELQRRVVLISTADSQGSGVLFRAGDGSLWVWSVAHVFEDQTSAFVRTFNGQNYRATVVRINRREDIALLSLRDRDDSVNGFRWLSGPRPDVGSRVWCAACPGGDSLPFSITAGVLSFQGRGVRGCLYDQTDASAISGSSGGGVFLASTGECLGLVSLGWGEGFIGFVPEWRVREFAQRNGVMFALDPSVPVPVTIGFTSEQGDEHRVFDVTPLWGGGSR